MLTVHQSFPYFYIKGWMVWTELGDGVTILPRLRIWSIMLGSCILRQLQELDCIDLITYVLITAQDSPSHAEICDASWYMRASSRGTLSCEISSCGLL